MNPNWLQIWQSEKNPVSEQELIEYYQGRLSPERQQAVEDWLQSTDFETEADEGLSLASKEVDLQQTVSQLHQQLQQQLQARKKKKEKRSIKSLPTAYLAVILVLLLIIVAFYVVRMLAR
jgi:anti-sigma factor RsiW